MTTRTYDIALAPVPAARPRIPARGKPYYPKTYAAWRDAASVFQPAPAQPLDGLCKVLIAVVCKRPTRLIAAAPTGDVDNFAKAALDALTAAGVWQDDKQVQILTLEKRYANIDENAYTHITITEIQPPDVTHQTKLRDAFHSWLITERSAQTFGDYEVYVEALCHYCKIEMRVKCIHINFHLPSEVTLSRWRSHYHRVIQQLPVTYPGQLVPSDELESDQTPKDKKIK